MKARQNLVGPLHSLRVDLGVWGVGGLGGGVCPAPYQTASMVTTALGWELTMQ